MFATYQTLLKRSFTDSFNRTEYKRWWKVPLIERFKFAIIIAPLAILIGFSSLLLPDAIGLPFVIFVAFFVLGPVIILWTDKLKHKYVK